MMTSTCLSMLKGQVLGRRQGAARGEDTLDDGVVGQVEEHDHPLHRAAPPRKTAAEVLGNVVFDAHGGKDDGEVRRPSATLA